MIWYTQFEMEENLGVSIVLINPQGQILLGERKNSYRAGYFGTPGGHVELSERVMDACRRELREETGVELPLQKFEYVGVVRELQDEGTYNFIHFGFVVRNFTGEVINAEPHKCKEWLWFAPNELPENILPGHKAVIEMVLDSSLPRFRDLV